MSLALNISARPKSLAGSRRSDLFKASNFPRAKNARPKHLLSGPARELGLIWRLSKCYRAHKDAFGIQGQKKPRNEEEKGRSQKLKRIMRIEFNKQTCFCCIGFGGGVSKDIVTGPSF